MKLSDYIAQFLVEQGIKHAFVISGGAAVHMIDSIARNPGIDYVCPQHEESGAMAADAYARVTGGLGCAITTSGPGGTNLLTGVCCAYFDSVPVIYLTGQVATFRLKPTPTMRQVGFQETDMPSIFRSVTKYTKLLRDPLMIRYELEKAVYMAKEGRPGPVLLDIPDDLQRKEIEPSELKSFVPEISKQLKSLDEIDAGIISLQQLIAEAERPVLVWGAGIRISHTEKMSKALTEKLGIPVLLTWGAMDIWPSDHPLNAGGLGACAPRGGNFAVQNSDLVIGIGTRFSQMITGGKVDQFARDAKKVMIDLEEEELNKFSGRGLEFDLKIEADLKDLLPRWLETLDDYVAIDRTEWSQKVQQWVKQWPITKPADYETKEEVAANVFIDALSDECSEGDVIITDAGGNLTWTMQGFKIKKDQRLFSAWNHSPMGYSLAAAYGASFADRGRNVISIIGDGGLQMCIEELATVSRHQLPVKIFLFNNQGHGIQKQTIETWLEGRYEALNYDSGLFFPDFVKVAEAYGLPAVSIDSHHNLHEEIAKVLSTPGPVFCNVAISPDQRILPMLTFGRPLEDQAPLLPREEFMKNMVIDPLPESLVEAKTVQASQGGLH